MCSPEVMASVRNQLRQRNRTIDRRHFISGAGAVAAAGALAPLRGWAQDATPVTDAATPVSTRASISFGTIVDLTHTLSPAFPLYAGKRPFEMETIATFAEDGF